MADTARLVLAPAGTDPCGAPFEDPTPPRRLGAADTDPMAPPTREGNRTDPGPPPDVDPETDDVLALVARVANAPYVPPMPVPEKGKESRGRGFVAHQSTAQPRPGNRTDPDRPSFLVDEAPIEEAPPVVKKPQATERVASTLVAPVSKTRRRVIWAVGLGAAVVAGGVVAELSGAFRRSPAQAAASSVPALCASPSPPQVAPPRAPASTAPTASTSTAPEPIAPPRATAPSSRPKASSTPSQRPSAAPTAVAPVVPNPSPAPTTHNGLAE
jgi:hypothetical protein